MMTAKAFHAIKAELTTHGAHVKACRAALAGAQGAEETAAARRAYTEATAASAAHWARYEAAKRDYDFMMATYHINTYAEIKALW